MFAVAREHGHAFSSANGLTFTYGEIDAPPACRGDVAPMVMLDPPDHTAFRRLVGRGPSRLSAVAGLEERGPRLRRRTPRAPASSCTGPTWYRSELFKPLPSMVVAHYLGVPAADRTRFDRWTNARIVAANAGGDVLQRRFRTPWTSCRATSPP